MSKVSVFDNKWIDLVFEGRNKQYGAYKLRQDDSKTTMIALFSGIAFMAAVVAIPVGISYLNPAQAMAPESPVTGTIINLPEDTDTFVAPPAVEEPEPPKPVTTPEPPAASAPPAVDVIKFNGTLTATNQPTPELPKVDDFENANPGSENVKGQPGGNITSVTSGVPEGTGNNPDATAPEGPTDVNFVDVMPLYPGGMDAFYKEVGRKYHIPTVDKEMTVRVYVSFVIEKDGSMTNEKILRDPIPGIGLGKEALRVLQGMKAQWKPGMKNGKPVRTAYNLPIIVNIK